MENIKSEHINRHTQLNIFHNNRFSAKWCYHHTTSKVQYLVKQWNKEFITHFCFKHIFNYMFKNKRFHISIHVEASLSDHIVKVN